MAYENYRALRVAVERGVARVTIDHGEINLFDLTLIVEMARLGPELEADEAVRVVVLQSANPHFFIAHADLNLIQGLPAAAPARAEKLGGFHAMCERFRVMPKATIAKIEGICRGGGSEFVQAFDMRFAARGRAVLSQPEVALGIIPGGGGCVRLPRLAGRSRALEVILGCDDFDADLAERYGYVNRALEPNEIGPFVDALAERIARFSPDAVRLAKAAVLKAEKSVEDDLVNEEKNFFESVATPAAKRAMKAAMESGFQTPAVERRPIAELLARLAR
jgi:enoyl-CoA hydratase/carnithine racemase